MGRGERGWGSFLAFSGFYNFFLLYFSLALGSRSCRSVGVGDYFIYSPLVGPCGGLVAGGVFGFLEGGF